jgi:hypothetical protein
MKTYPKIETLFNRGLNGQKLLISDSYRNDTVKMLAELPIWVAYEKLDGSNHQIEWDGHKLMLSGRTENSNIQSEVTEYFNSKFNNNETEEVLEQLFGEKKFILFFEAIGPKIQSYGSFYSSSVKFVLLDIFSDSSDSWLSYKNLQEIATALGVDIKQQYKVGTLLDFVEEVKKMPLSISSEKELPLEGFVCVPSVEIKDSQGNRIIVKIKCCDFVENNTYKQIMKSYTNNSSQDDKQRLYTLLYNQ